MEITNRELEVLELIAKEFTTEKISQILHVSISTVETHRRNLFRKLEVSSVVGLVKEGFRRGLIKIF
jgi:DNA-binding CsgD family transcriptional regulator